MKKVILLIAIIFSTYTAQAQRAVYHEDTNGLYAKGKEMFANKNYLGAINTLEEFKKTATDKHLLEETNYMILSSHYYRGKDDIELDLKNFLEEHPSTSHRHQLAFFAGTVHFDRKEWMQASYWFNRSDIDYLSVSDQEDHSYRAAYSFLQTKNPEDSKRLFSILSRNSRKYSDRASYYLAYIDFQNKDYNRALTVFRKLQPKEEFREKATLFILQGEFLNGNLREVISEGEKYISNYPKTDSSAEIYRLMGNSYYRLGQFDKAITSYEKYSSQENKPIRDDMYQLADAYYQNGQAQKTINTLKHVASTDDVLGQAGNMLLGQAYLKLNDNSSAMMSFDAAARVNHSPIISEEALYNYVMLVNKGSVSTFGESITALQNFLLSYPNSKHKEEVSGAMASTLLSVKNYPMALETIAKIKSPGKAILEAKQIILYQQGVQVFLDGKYDIAKQNFSEVITMPTYDLKSKNESYFWRGDASYRQGAYREAITDFQSYSKLAHYTDENYALNFYNLGYSYFQVKDYNSALSNFKRYTEVETNKQSANYTDAMNRIGDSYLFNRNFQEAERYYANASKANPASADYAEFQKAFVLGLQRNYSGKVSALNSMMQNYPNSPYMDNALYEKSRALVMQSKENEAIQVLIKLLKDHPQTALAPKAGVQLGQLYFNENKPKEALNAYKKVIADYPSTEEARTAIKSMEGVYRELNDINSYAEYLKSSGKGSILTASRQDSLTYLAAENVYMKSNKSAGAKTALSNYLKSYPNGAFSSDAHFYLGNMTFESKDLSSALDHFKFVIQSNNPKYMDDALILASGIEFDKKDYDAAYKNYSVLNERGSTTANKHIGQLGMLRCSYLTNKDNEVVKSANLLLDNKQLSNENKMEALFYRGRSNNNLGKKTSAIEDLSQVAQQTRTALGAESQFIIADIHYKNGEYDKVQKQVLDFMKAGSSHEYWMARSILVLADSYKAQGDDFQAKQYLESLQANYKGKEADIQKGISERLANLNK